MSRPGRRTKAGERLLATQALAARTADGLFLAGYAVRVLEPTRRQPEWLVRWYSKGECK